VRTEVRAGMVCRNRHDTEMERASLGTHRADFVGPSAALTVLPIFVLACDKRARSTPFARSLAGGIEASASAAGFVVCEVVLAGIGGR